jgi:hypothetical protein
MTWEVCGKSLIVFGYKLSSANTVCLLKACFGRRVVRCFKLYSKVQCHLERQISKLPSWNGQGIATDQRSYSMTIAKKLCYGIYDDAGNLNISSLLKFNFSLTDNLIINEMNTV